ncbi:hypothetical protein GUJ93_ZPchr0004g39738 [Zizania palustris]|uniref:Uncharacterized protein n=1 Tax=Zizania palustris TaxID=103762 RepID=A0A8J5S120_ZIZPA|nr:hypothetical protein GUJ93_ZPchr0004g39738 [Zizania palustris]
MEDLLSLIGQNHTKEPFPPTEAAAIAGGRPQVEQKPARPSGEGDPRPGPSQGFRDSAGRRGGCAGEGGETNRAVVTGAVASSPPAPLVGVDE